MTSRDIKQEENVNDFLSLVRNGAVGGALQACTGYGKTTVGLKIAQRLNKNFSIHIIVPTINLKDQWDEKITSLGLTNAAVFVVNTYITLPDEARNCFFLILDEAHRYTNEEAKLFSTVLDKTTFSSTLLLSATFSKEQLEFMASKGIHVFCTITIEEASARGWVSRYIQYNLKVKLTDEELEKYTKCSNIMKAHSPFLDGLDVFTAGKDKRALWQFCQDNGHDYKDIQMRLARFNVSSSARKAIVYGAVNKIEVCKEIVNHVGKKSIIFSETKKFAEDAYKSMQDVAVLYHSGLRDKQKTLALETIKLDKTKAICAPKALDEGIDIPSLKCGIIASGTSIDRQQIQRINIPVLYKAI